MLVDGSIRRSAARKVAGLAAVTALALGLASSAQAYQVAPGWTASDYATGFAYQPGAAGPVGSAFDSSGNLLVADGYTHAVYKVPPGGGSASSTQLRSGYGGSTGLAFDKSGRLYLARGTMHDVVELNPASGEIIRTVATGLPCPAALATDPISGDLFVSNVFCSGGGIKRISNFQNGTGTVRSYAGGTDADGLTFAPDGTLYAASSNRVLRIAGTNSSNPGNVSTIATVPTADGIAFAPASASSDQFLLVARNDGEIDRVDLGGNVTPVLTGGSRGDLVTVGPDHCMYADLQDRVIKIGPSTGSCGFSPPLQAVLGQRSAARVVDTSVKARAPKTVRRGSRFTVTLKVANDSGTVAHSPQVVDTLPKGTKFVSARSARGVSCRQRGRTVTCRKASLAGGKSFTVRIVLRSISRSVYVDQAKVRSKDLDPKPGNNKARTRTRVTSGNSVLGVQRRGRYLPRTTG